MRLDLFQSHQDEAEGFVVGCHLFFDFPEYPSLSRDFNFYAIEELPVKNRFLVLPLAALAANCAIAQNQTSYDELVVTAAKVSQTVGETLASVEVFNAQDIEQSMASDLPELLRGLAGVDIFDNGGRGATASISLRGLASDNTLILVDGQRVSSATSGATAVQHIPLNLIERVEVVKGPKSSLYGADALAGVIQVFTKEEPAPYLNLSYGSFNTYETAAGYSYKEDSRSFAINFSSSTSEGFSRVEDGMGLDADDDGYDEFGISLSGAYELDNGDNIYANFLRSVGTTEFDSGGNDSIDFENQSLRVGYDTNLSENFSADFELGFAEDDSETFSSNPSVFQTQRYMFNAQFDYQLADQQVLTFGYDYFDDQVESTQAFDQTSRDNHAVFAQYLASLGNFSIQAGIRSDDNESFGRQTTGNIAVGAQVSESIDVVVSYGTAFKSPTFNDQFFPLTDFGGGTLFQGNPNLQPEESDSYELLVRGNSGPFNWSASIYRTEVENLINGFAFDAGSGIFTAINVDEADITGGEFSLGYALDTWYTKLGVSYTDAEDSTTGERLARTARSQANLDVVKTFDQFDVALSIYTQDNRISGASRLGGYGLVDISGNYELSGSTRLSLAITNLFDKEYFLTSSFSGNFQTEGRAINISVNHKL